MDLYRGRLVLLPSGRLEPACVVVEDGVVKDVIEGMDNVDKEFKFRQVLLKNIILRILNNTKVFKKIL